MSFKSPLSYAALLLALLILAACGRTVPDGQEVTFMISGDPAELAAYRTLVESFGLQHPEIDVSLIHVAGGKQFREKLSTMFSANIPPDVFLYNYRRLGDYAAAGAIHPLGDRLDGSSVFAAADFYPVAIDAFTFRGELQCIPQNISSPVIYYNKALFDEASLPYPEAGWTPDEFLETARSLTLDRDGDGRTDQWGFGTDVETIRLAPFVWTGGGDFFDDPQDPGHLVLDEARAREAVRWFLDLQLADHVAPDIIAETAQSSEDRFLGGSVAMLMNSRVGVPAMRTITAFEWDAAPLPLGPGAVSVLHSDGFCMSARAGEDEVHAEAVWTFIEFSVSEEGQRILAGTGRTVPSMISVAESAEFLDSSPPANNRIWLDAARSMRALPMMPGWNTFEELLSKELQRAFFGDIGLDELLANAQDLADPLLR